MSATLRTGGGRPARPPDFYLDAGREYVRRYGAASLTQAALNPAAAKRGGRPDLVETYYQGRLDGTPWPSLNAVKKSFGTFNAFRDALGLPPNSTGPATGRRKAGEAGPILDVRERRVVVPDATTTWLRTQLAKAERRAERLAEQLDAARTGVRRVDTEKTIKDLRDRLADERARSRAVQRELTKAEKRDRAATREVERLTERLAEARTRPVRIVTKTVPGKATTKTKTVTKTVQVRDSALLAQIEKLEDQVRDLRASLARSEALRVVNAERLGEIRSDAIESAAKSQLVRTAQRRVAEAEKRAEELAEILVGERRVLTEDEIADLRTDGPAGDAIFIAMVKRLGRAEGTRARRDALTDVIAAAVNWKDRL